MEFGVTFQTNPPGWQVVDPFTFSVAQRLEQYHAKTDQPTKGHAGIKQDVRRRQESIASHTGMPLDIPS